ncbi:PBSX family phage terminase large subunit [Mediterraneibacter gnavus]|uniref:PBSX family phage terminase large subunit n=1 Tax=Mediterraneibacter gnavus TaxID=33038 RepID=UPI00356A4C4E
MQLSQKQNEYILNATHRWNIKSGAVRSGKSFVDTAYIVPQRIRERAGLSGLNVIMGVSKESIERNVLQPMREIYTSDLIGNINSRNVARVCGEDVYCLGAEKVSQVAKIQGASIKYCYGDEIAKWNKEVFQMLKSRLDKTYSCFDGACNPENPTHWLKEFIDNKELDIYLQKYTIFDNPFLDPEFVKQLCKEYEGTVYYDRLILGLWKRAEGAIYRKFADHPEEFIKEPAASDLTEIAIGVDFGGNKSGHSFVARGYDRDNNVYGLKSVRHMNKDFKDGIDSNILNDLLIKFVNEVQEKYGKVDFIYWDNAETTLGQSIRNAMLKANPATIVRPAKKNRIKDRIECVLKLMGAGRFFITEDCETLSTALQEAVWDEKAMKDDRLDDGSSDIDTLDAFEYTIERDIKMLTE